MNPAAETSQFNQCNQPNTLQLTDFVDLSKLVTMKPTQKDLDKHLQEIAASHDQWYQNEHTTSRKVLHGILGKAYTFYQLSKSDATPRKVRAQMWEAVNDRVAERGIKQFNRDVHDAGKLLKAVFGYKNRQRVTSCSTVIHVARKQEVDPSEFTDWLTREGGIEAVRLANAGQGRGKTMAQKVQEGRAKLPTAARASFKPDLSKLSFGSDDISSKCLLIAEYTATGELEIFDVVRSTSALNAAYAAIK